MVSIITINYNGWQDTCELIASIKRYETFSYEIIVVDNASVGNDVEQIEFLHPDVTVIQSNKNLGFAGGNNLGYQYAKGEYIFFLNNDMIVKTPFLHPMVERLADKKYAGVSPCIIFLYKTDYIQYYGYRNMTSITLKHTTEAFDASHREYFMYPKETEVLHGGAMMVRRDVIENIGLMTEVYFLFYEEFDWSLRMKEAGYKLFYEPLSILYHKESMTIKPQSPLREYYLTRSRMIFARRNCKGYKKYLSCTYQFLIALPVKSIRCITKRRLDLLKAVWKGAIKGITDEKNENCKDYRSVV